MEYLIVNERWLRPSIREVVGTQEGIEAGNGRFRPPVTRPAKLLCAFANYREDGAREAVRLDLFLKSPASLFGDGDTVALPTVEATIFHHEAELALVIGKRASRVSAAEAPDYVFGLNISARGTGGHTMFQGKSYDMFGPIGPAIVTADEIADPHDLQVTLSVNGHLRQRCNTSDMANRIPQLIAFASSVSTLEPGDAIATGTNHLGLGPVQDGDTVALEISNLGTLTVNVTGERKRGWSREIEQEMAQRARAT